MNSVVCARAKTCRSIGIFRLVKARQTVVSVPSSNSMPAVAVPSSPSMFFLMMIRTGVSVIISVSTLASISAFIRFASALAFLASALSFVVLFTTLGTNEFRGRRASSPGLRLSRPMEGATHHLYALSIKRHFEGVWAARVPRAHSHCRIG